ncbi:MAG: sensor histidine kinase [Hyphomonadaceae bacterium]|jgi:signal transduction histidine kinase
MTETASAESDGARVRGSIARRMLVAAAIWSALVLLIAGWSLQAFYRTETDQQLDLSLDDTLRTLAGAVNSEQGQIEVDDAKLPRDERFSLPLLGRYWAFIDLSAENEVVRTRKSPSFFDEDAGVAADVRAEALKRKGAVLHLDAPGPDSKQMRVGLQAVTFPDRPEPLLLYAAIDRTSADASVGSFTLRLGIALGVLAVGLIGGVLVLIRYGLRPLHEIEDKLGDVRAGRRDKLDGEYPSELSPLVREINTLITHNRNVVDRARTHVGNLAHALKTPLAVLKNEAKGSDRLSGLVRRQTEAMTSNVNSYLKRAQAAAQAEVLGVRTEVKEPVEGIARMLERLHRDKGVAIDVDVDPKAVFRGERGDFDELVGNLLENAAKWCKSQVNVTVTRNDDGMEVKVDDDGPGLPVEHRAKALERGKRLDESEPGTGLGLSIVSELADIYGGRLHLEDSPIGGLRARLVLPAAPL